MNTMRRVTTGCVVLALVVSLAACDNGLRGPDPTEASITAIEGPFPVESFTVPAGNGFGGGTIWAPVDDSQTYGAVAVMPGFLTGEDTIAWYGPRLASQGFVVLTLASNSPLDQPAARGTQMLAALDWLHASSPVRDRVAEDRDAVMGWSMGGGGALYAGLQRPFGIEPDTEHIRAVVGLAPWASNRDHSALRVPTLIIACQNDDIAPVSSHAGPIHDSLDAGLARTYVELRNASHFCVSTTPNEAQKQVIMRQVLAHLKRFVDGDERYAPFLCPPAPNDLISDRRSTACP